MGVRAQECTTRFALDPARLTVTSGPDGPRVIYQRGKDYDADPEWASVGRLAQGRIKPAQPVLISYEYTEQRLDSIILDASGKMALKPGIPHLATPLPPALAAGERRLANIFIERKIARLDWDNLYPLLETAYPEPPKPSPSIAERLLPKTMKRLGAGGRLKILAWGDSVTDGGFLADLDKERWQSQFAARLRDRFPQARIELLTEAWGGRNTTQYLAEPPGSIHNYREKVLAARPDLIVMEFVNDAGLHGEQLEKQYGQLLEDISGIGAEWIILTPHYVRPDWMGLARQKEIDDDPRPYVQSLRKFTAEHRVPLADASRRYGRLWRQGIPYNTLMKNNINHPDARGMKIFADSLLALFP
jgi:lysophospholipase L1-like esterase